MNIRFAAAKDSSSLLKIYESYIETPITFEYTLPTVEEFEKRILSIAQEYPYLVCEEDGNIIGYAYAHRAMERAAYQWNAELSVYLDPSATSQGLGKKLYTILIDILRIQGIKTVYGVVTVPNEKSEKLHASMGFRRLAVYSAAGYKCGKWHDVVWFEKEIAPHEASPDPIRPISSIAKETLEEMIRNDL